jgi:hypothetical protein
MTHTTIDLLLLDGLQTRWLVDNSAWLKRFEDQDKRLILVAVQLTKLPRLNCRI